MAPGASKGYLGQAGAGVILRADDGTLVHSLNSSLDEHNLESRVKTAIEAEAITQQKLAAGEAEIADLRQKFEASKREKIKLSDVLKSKHEENEVYLSKIESIGHAYDVVQTQNQHLLQQVTERDDYNTKKLKDPEKASPTKAQVYIETRKRNPEKEYKISIDVINSKISKSEKLFSEDEISHGPSWLIERHAKTAKEKNIGKDDYVQQLTSEIRKELAAEMEEKVNKKVQENLRRVLKKFGEVNPSFNLDVEELYTSDFSDENGTLVTPVTPATTVEGTNGAGASS